jgi:hypothetical protein
VTENAEFVIENPMRKLTVELLKMEAKAFAERESTYQVRSLYGVTDGKAVGTYLEHKFQEVLKKKYKFTRSSSAKGIDFPQMAVDIKATSVRQPQSSCPFKSARQKIYGLGYSLLVFVYEKKDLVKSHAAVLNIRNAIFVESNQTADFQTTTGILKILANRGNVDDICAFMAERFLPVDDIQAHKLAGEILKKPPVVGYLTISNALQWRLQYARAIEQAGKVHGVQRIV